MDLYLIRMTDGEGTEVRLVAARRERVATSWGELQAAKLSRMVGRTWSVHTVAKIDDVPLAEDPDGKVRVSLVE